MRRLLPLLILLAACDSPTPRMIGAERHEVTRGGYDYVLYRRDRDVEVIRLGYAPRGAHQAIRATMISLIRDVTGCDPIGSTLRGDSGEIRGRLDC